MASYNLAFHASASRSILFGLAITPNVMQTWAYNAATNTWQNRAPASQPGNRASHTMDYDATLDRTVLFGGAQFLTIFADTWEYSYAANTWTQTTPTPSPPGRTS